MRNGDKGMKVLGLIVILMFVGLIFSGVVAATTYDPQAAVNYADTWWNGRNPNYHDYSNEGGDCANFVSQCLIAGGLDLSGHPGADSWGCIPSCTNLHDYLVNYLGATYEARPKSQMEPIWFVPGDPAIFPTPKHAVFAVTGDATHYATCNAHSTDRNHKTIQWFFDNSNWNSCTYYHIPTDIPTPPAPPTITSPGSSSGPGPTIDTLTPTLQWNSVSNSNADKYLYDMGIATGQSVGYYEPYQTQLDSELHNIEAPNQPPTAIIDPITPDPAVQGTDTVSFSGHGTDPDGTVEAYNWSSSIDGQLSTSAAFTKPASELSVGTHTIYFKVQDNDGAWSTEDTEDLTITPANQQPTAIIDSITPDSAEQGTDTVSVSFSGHGTDTDGTVVAYNWSSSIDGQLSTSASFNKPASELSVGTHTIYFKVQDNDGAWSTEDTEDLTITPANQPPTAIIDSITPDPAEQGTDTVSVSFTGHGTDTDGTVVAYNWSSSIDGPLSTSAAFTKPASELSVGTHTIYFKVQDNDGAWSTEDTEDLTIYPANQPPTAIIDSITPDPAVQGTDTVFFSGHGTDPDGTVVAYNWSSSIDGPLSTSAAFTKPASELSVGTHTFYFKVQDNDGAWSTEDTEDLTIYPANQPPTAIIDSITPDPAVQGTDTVFFSGHGTDPDGTVVAYNWSSSIDGPLSTSAAFTKPASELSVGTHTFYFKVQDNDGAWSTEDTEDLTIYPGPELSYSPESRDFCDMREGETDSTTFELWNSGTDTLTYSLSETCDWLEVNPTSGSSTGEHNSITVDMDTTGLSEGSHTCDIKINSNDESGTFTVMVNVVPCPCGNKGVNPTSWSPTLNCGESDSQIVTVSASDCIVNAVTVSKISGPTWLSVSQTDLGDIASGSSETFTVTAAPPAGTSSGDYPYTIRVSNTCGTPSTRDVAGTINVNENADGQTDYWAVIVGVADYTGTSHDLAYTDDDAIDLYNTLLLSGDYWQPDHIKLLLDSKANKAGILTAFNWLDDNEDPDDVVLFFFSGHGTYGPDDDGDELDGWDEFFCPYDFNNIRDDELDAELDRLGSTSIAVIMDTCFAGGMTKDSSVKTLPKQKVELTDGFAKDIQDEKKDMGDAGRVVLMACDDDEYSYEIYELENGLFSYYVIEGLERSADAEGNGDNICSAEETFVYAEPRVVDFISTQNPQLYDGYTGELPITRPPCPELSYSPTSHDYGDKCEGVTDSTTFELWNSGTGTLTYSLSETCDWLDVNPTSGSSTGEHDTITVDIDTTSLFEGSHTCDITINSNDGSGTFTVMVNVVSCPCGNMGVNPTSWSPTLNCGESDNEIVTVSASDNIVNGVTVSKVSGPTWLSVSPTDLGDIASGSSKTFTMTTSPPSGTSGDFPYTIRVSNTCGTPSTRDVSGTINVSCPCGNMGVNPTSWSPTLNCGESDNEIVTVSASDNIVNGVTVSKVSGPTWLSVSPTDLGDIASGSSKTFTMTTSPPSGTSGDFPYTIRVSNTCGTPSTRDVSGTINVSCPCGNMGGNSTSWSPTLNCGESDNEIVTVSASDNIVNGVTVSKVSGPTWLSVSPTDLGDIASGSSKTFTMTTSPPSGTSGDFPYTATVSNTCGTPSSRDVSGTIHVECCGNMGVNPTTWSPPTINCSETDNEIVTVSATGGTVEGVTVSKISGETWVTLSQTNLGDIPSGSSETFTVTAAPPAGTSSGDYPYTIRVSNTCGTPSSKDVTGTITVYCPELSYSPESHDFGDKCEGDTDSTTFEIWNSGTGTLTYSRCESCGWVDVNPTSGSSTGEHDTITVDIDTTSLSEGSHTCDITINSNDGTGTFTVTVTVVPYPESSWTFMVYLDGDNNLESCAIDDFLEMSSVSSTAGVNIVVQFDRRPSYSSAYDDWTTCKRFLVTPGMTPTPANALTDLGECNMGDPNTLSDFVDWAMTQYPADKYALILWDHGSGWKEKKWVPWEDETGIARWICMDDTNGYDYLTLQETEQALAGKSLSLLGYDACLMHMVEVVYQVMDNAGISVGSEESEQGDGWPYNTILSDLTGTPTMTPTTLGTTIVQRYIEFYGTGGDDTQSAVDNGDVSGLVTAVDNLAQALMTEINAGHVAEVQQARNAAAEIYYNYYIDLYHFAEMVDTYVPGARTQAQAVMNSMGVAVYEEAHGTSVLNDHGLSIYFPRVEGDYLASYDNTAFAVDTQWNEFLKRYYEGPELVCEGTATSCGIYPNCENCNEKDGCYVYDNGCEERNYYCVSNEAGCSYTPSNRHTDYYDDWDYYCDGDTVRKHRLWHNYYCDAGTCTDHTRMEDDQLVENCNDHDGWVDTGNTDWVDVNECQEKERKEQKYRDYYCSGGACTYSEGGTKWVDTENTRNKPDGTICGCTASNTLKRCYGGVCTDTGICNSSICGADAACDGKEPGDSCGGGGICDSTCKCGGQAVGEDYGIFSAPLWFVDKNGDHLADDVFGYGFTGATPLVGDFNQDGSDDIAVVYLPWWFVDTNGDHIADETFGYGFAGGTPLVGDFNQDGKDDIAVVSLPTWFVDTDRDQVADDTFGYGFAGATPMVGDFNQDGKDDIAVVSLPWWFVDTDRDQVADDTFGYGFAGATPMVGDFNQDGKDDIAVVSLPWWFVDTDRDQVADDTFGYGFAGATPIVGDIG